MKSEHAYSFQTAFLVIDLLFFASWSIPEPSCADILSKRISIPLDPAVEQRAWRFLLGDYYIDDDA